MIREAGRTAVSMQNAMTRLTPCMLFDSLYSCDRWFLNEDSSTASMKSVQTTTMVGHSTTTTGLSCFFTSLSYFSTALYVHKALFAHIIIFAALKFLNSFPTPSSHRFKFFHKLSFKKTRSQFNISTKV
uniref:(northern house mosquito) hypothetical protein n=1 Tax=Culex pipiens TaxID=7175 RepID=A0A8D8NRB9_CULPI